MHYTLSQILEIYKRGCEELFGEFDFWSTWEVARCQKKGKYYYLELVEYDQNGVVLAKCTAPIFQYDVVDSFLAATQMKPDDMAKQQILFHGKYSFHAQYGFSIVIDEISPAYTLWKLQQSKDIIVETLTQEWVMNNNIRLPAPQVPLRIAVVTGEKAAGFEDFIAILDDAGVIYSCSVFTATVHGNNAKADVYRALQEVYRRSDEFDLVCLVRGWGDSTWIARQNDLDIARGICHMPIPVYIAVGHTQDTSILQKVARHVAKTPSDAAHHLVNLYNEASHEIAELLTSVQHIGREILLQREMLIHRRYDGICRSIGVEILRRQQRIDSVYETISAYHPEHLLARGYAVVRGELLPGSEITIDTLHDTVVATVKSVAKRGVYR